MGRKTRKSASSKARAKAKAKARPSTTGGRDKPPLTLEEMLARIPDKEYLSTREVQHVFNDAHPISVYRWVKKGELEAFRVRSRGKANVFKREGIVAAVRARFTPRPVKMD